MKRILTAAMAGLALLVFASGAAGAPAHQRPTQECENPSDYDTFRVEIVPLTQTIRRGEVARVAATVYRSIDGRDLAPAEGANVVVALWKGDYVRGAGATTDHHGEAVVEVRLDRGFPSGWVHATARATKRPAKLPCDPAQEAGGTKVERFLRVL